MLALELLSRIPRGSKVTATRLHRQLADAGFARDKRSIERMLDALGRHFDIERDDRSRPYGYRWMSHARGLAMPRLSPQESLLLQLAARHRKRCALLWRSDQPLGLALVSLGDRLPVFRSSDRALEWLKEVRECPMPATR